jgi:Penicillin-insensitive murein endopeptidase
MRSPLPALLGALALALIAASLLVVARATDPAPRVAEHGRDLPPAASAGQGGPRHHGARASPQRAGQERPRWPRVEWRRSVAIGAPEAGRLERGVVLPHEGARFFTWDPIRKRQPNRSWRRWGTDDLIRTTLRVIRDFAAAYPAAPRIGIGDLSRPEGGDFGPQYGGVGHATHQSGLDIDVYYPRRDEAERPPPGASEIDPELSQDLVDRFVAAGAVRIFVGPNTGLKGPPGVVVPLVHHDNHLHVRVSG